MYDNDQRLTAENWMNGSTVIASMNYGYDLDNELTSASDPNSAYAFAYNGDGQVTSVDNAGTPNVPHVVLASGYDLLGDRTSLSATIAGTADFANTYAYDGDQNRTMVQQQGVQGGNAVSPKEIDYGYNAIGQFTSAADYNFIGVGPRVDVLAGAYSYDNDGRLTGLAYTSNGGQTTIDTLGWGYDAASNITSFTSIDGTATYGYDPTNQLTSATYVTASGGHQPANEVFSFDANGNRNMAGYATGSDNLMSSDGTYNYQHDADGNTTVRTRISNAYATDYRTTFSWDYRNRLTDVEYFDNNGVITKHVHYVYGVFDHLLATEVDPTGGGTYTSIQHYVLDASPEIPIAGVPGTALAQPDLEFDGNGNLTQRNLVALNPAGVDAVMAQEAVASLAQAGTDTWIADNNLRSPVDVADNSGALANHIVYAVFGKIAYQSNSAVTVWAGFGGGHVSLDTDLILDGLRWLNIDTGGWLSEDPSGFAAHDADLSRYVGNEPASAIDPTGLIANSLQNNALYQAQEQFFGTINNFLGIDQNSVMARYRARQQLGSGQGLVQIGSQQYLAMMQSGMRQNQAVPAQQSDWLDNASNFAAGWGDTLSFNVTYGIRELAGWNSGINTSSGWYRGGQVVGAAHSIAIGGAMGWRAAGRPAPGVEFSHWIPARVGGPRTIFNGNYVSTVRHALSDPYRYQFMTRSWKSWAPMPSNLWQQVVRFPRIYVGIGGGGLYGGGSVALNGAVGS